MLRANWDGTSPTAIIVSNKTQLEGSTLYRNNFLDQGVVDPLGQLQTGTFRFSGCVSTPEVNGSLYLFRKNEIIEDTIIQNLKEISGFAWNVKRNLMYFMDSCDYCIREYKWDPNTGLIGKNHMSFNTQAIFS